MSIPLFGHLSDRFGRKRIYMLGAALTGAYGFVYFGLLDTRAPLLVFLAIVLSLIPHDMLYGPQAALIAESFPAHLRYSGASLGYQLSSVIAGGPAPLIAAWLISRYHSGTAIATFILVCAIVTLLATAGLKDLESRIRVERYLTPQDIHERYGVLNGAIYGIASHGRLQGGFKPANHSADVKGLYLAGGAAHPGQSAGLCRAVDQSRQRKGSPRRIRKHFAREDRSACVHERHDFPLGAFSQAAIGGKREIAAAFVAHGVHQRGHH